MSDTTRKPLPSLSNRPRFKAGTTIRSSTGEEVRVGGSFISDEILEVIRNHSGTGRPRYRAGTVIRSTSGQEVKPGGSFISDDVIQAVKEWEASQQEESDIESEVTPQQTNEYQRPSRLQRMGSAITRSARTIGALGPLGVIRSINRAANADGGASLIDFDAMDRRTVREVSASSNPNTAREINTSNNPNTIREVNTNPQQASGGISGGSVERLLFSINTNMSSVRNSLAKIETNVSKIVDTIAPTEGTKAPAKGGKGEEGGGGGLMGLIGSLFGGIGNIFGGGAGGAGIGAIIRRLVSTVARAIFTKIPIIGPILLVALNIEGAMEEYERNGLGAAITDLIAGIGSDLTFGIIDKDTIKNIINTSLETLKRWWDTGTEALQNILGGIVSTITGFFRWATDTLRDFLDRFRRRRRELEEAAREGDEERLNNLANMNPRQLAGAGPGQTAARRMVESRNVSSEELGNIQQALETPEEGETPEQRQERERLDSQLRRLERTERASDGGLTIPPELNQYLEDRRNRANRASTNATQSVPERVPSEPPAAAPASNTQNPIIQNRIDELMQMGMSEQQARETATSEYNNINRPVSNNVAPAEALPVPDNRAQTITQGANQPNVVAVPSAAPAAAPAPQSNRAGGNSDNGQVARARARNNATVSPIPSTPAQAATQALGIR